MAREQRRLAAIVVADVAGYSRLMGDDESGTLAALKALRSTVIDPLIAEHGGRIVKTIGDGLLLEFASVVDAVHCSVRMQQSVEAAGAGLDEHRRIRLRLGINLGDVIIDEGDIFGDGVNIAARLEALAVPGGICLSQAVFDGVRNKIPASFADGGQRVLKNISEPVHVWEWVPEDGSNTSAAKSGGSNRLPDKPSIVVLPFQNMSADPDQEYFADGTCEEITALLARQAHLFVIARNSAFTYKGRAVDVRTVARELGVRYVLEGSVRKAAARIRVTAQLIDAASGTHVWSESYDRDLVDIFTIQDEIAQAITGALMPRIVFAEGVAAARKRPESLDAWGFTVRAFTRWWADPDRTAAEEAIRFARAAVALDPAYALPQGLLAGLLAYSSWALWTPDWLATAREAGKFGESALRLQSDDPTVLTDVAFAHNVMGRFVSSRDLAERAVELCPNDAHALAQYALGLAICRRPEDGRRMVERAIRLSPRDPREFLFWVAHSACAFFSGSYDDAVAWARRAVRSKPQYLPGWTYLAAALALSGHLAEARTAIDKHRTLGPMMRLEVYQRPRTEGIDWQKLVDALALAGLD